MLASPKQQTATASRGQRAGTPSRLARLIENATPTARGRCEAIVEVCGMTASEASPNTLCRPPDAGSSVLASMPSSTARSASSSCGRPAARGPGRTRRSGSAAAPGRWGAAPRRRTRWTRGRPSRSCSSPAPCSRIRRAWMSSSRLPAIASKSGEQLGCAVPGAEACCVERGQFGADVGVEVVVRGGGAGHAHDHAAPQRPKSSGLAAHLEGPGDQWPLHRQPQDRADLEGQ